MPDATNPGSSKWDDGLRTDGALATISSNISSSVGSGPAKMVAIAANAPAITSAFRLRLRHSQ